MRRKLLGIIMAIAAISSLIFGLVGCSLSPNKEIINVTAADRDGNEENLRVGVYSDTQLNRSNTYDSLYAGHLRETFKLFKEQNVELILFAGDMVDLVSDEAYETHNKIWNEVFGENGPEKLYIMGNHDYWFENDYQSTTPKQKIFSKHLNQSPWEHRVINGFHFIAASPSRGAGYDKRELKWLKEQLDIAYKDNSEQPIFVLTHQNVQNTVYGSTDWGAKELVGVFDDYPNVVSLSGHSHNAMLDERSIYQDKFTAIQTQSIAYIEQGDDKDKYNPDRDAISTIPPREDDAPMCYIMNVGKKNTIVERWNVMLKAEEKSDMRWELNYPLRPGNFKYTKDLAELKRTKPYFENATVKIENITTKKTDNKGLVFTPAENDYDNVYAYLVKLTDSNGNVQTIKYFSEYYLGASASKGDVRLGLPSSLKSGTYIAEIWAQESFGSYSSNYLISEPFAYVQKAPMK